MSGFWDWFTHAEGWDFMAVFLAMLAASLGVLWVLVWWLPTRRMNWMQRDEYMHLLLALGIVGILVLGVAFGDSGG